MDGDLSDQQRHFVTTYLTRAGPVADDVRDTVQLFVDDHNGKSWVVDAALDRPVRDAVLAGMAKAGISASAFQTMDAYVTHASKVVDLKKTVRDSGLTRDATLRVMMRLRGGGNPLTSPPEIEDGMTHRAYAEAFATELMQIPGFRNGDLLQKFIDNMDALSRSSWSLFDQNNPIVGDGVDKEAVQKSRLVDFCAVIEELRNANGLTKRESMMLKWMLGIQKSSQGERGIGMKMDDSGKMSGRPPFSTYTKDTLEEVEIQTNIDTNMRHVVAWHTIRDAYNTLIDAMGSKDHAFDALGSLFEPKRGQIPEEVREQLDGKIKQLINDRVLANEHDPARYAYEALYVMNSNVENLWKGDGPANQILPQIYNNTERVLTGLINGRTELSVNDCYEIATALGHMSDDKSDTTYATALLSLSLDIERTLQGYQAQDKSIDPSAPDRSLPDYLQTRAKIVCLPAELDLIPTDGAASSSGAVPERDQVRQKGQKPSVIAATEFLIGNDRSPDLILTLFDSLLSYDEL